jgi:hypothetical protein
LRCTVAIKSDINVHRRACQEAIRIIAAQKMMKSEYSGVLQRAYQGKKLEGF